MTLVLGIANTKHPIDDLKSLPNMVIGISEWNTIEYGKVRVVMYDDLVQLAHLILPG